MAADVGSLQARLFLDYSKFHSGMESATADAKNLGSTLQNAFNGFSPDQATIVRKATQLSQTLGNIFAKTQATVRLNLDSSNFETTAHEVNEWVSSVRDRLSTGLSDVTPHINITEAQTELDNLKNTISEFRAFADQQLHDIRPSIHIGNANRSLNTVRQNIETLRTNASQPVNMLANIDTAPATEAMGSLVSRAQQIGQEISDALGRADPSNFYQTSSAMQAMAQAMEDIITRANAFESALQNMNQTLQQISAVRTFTSQLSQMFNEISTAAETAAESVSNFSEQFWGLASILEAFTGDQSYFFSDMTSQIDGMANAAARFAASMQDARAQMGHAQRESRQLEPNTRGAAREAERLQTHLQSSVHWADRLKQIIGGIVISQAFYQITGMIRSWIGMANEFAMEMEQAAISFKYLMGDANEALSFIQALQDFAVESPLDTAGAEKAARLLMTMGVTAENTIPVLRVLTDTATVAGGEIEDTVYRISLALGQMLQSGTVKMQEIRQLVNANIPIYSILQEELGLTAKQVSQIGKAGVDSYEAVNAILRGLQKRFGGAAKEMQSTVKGAMNAIRDSFAVLYNTIISGPYEWLRDRLVDIAAIMTVMVNIIRRVGPGGLFEALFTPEQQAILRNLIGAFGQLGQAIKYTAILIGTVLGDSLKTLAYWLNLILPPIAIFLNGLMQLAVYLYRNIPIIRQFVGALGAVAIIINIVIPLLVTLWKILGFAKLFTWASTCVIGFGKALLWLIAHPVALAIAGLTALIAVIAYLSGAFDGLISKIKGVVSKWTGLNKTLNAGLNLGYDPNKILQPWEDKGVDNNSQKYLGLLKDIQNTMGDVGDEADKTKKKLKNSFLQSFDEVYQIKPKEDDSAKTAKDLGLDDYDFPIEVFDIPENIPDLVKDLGNALGDLAAPGDSFWDSWKDVFSNWPDWLAPLLAASIGAIIGAALGGVPGALIGAAIGGLVGWLWDQIAEAFNLDPDQKVKAAITSGITAALGGILGYVIGGPLGAVLGIILGTFAGEFWSILCDKLQLTDYTRYGAPIIAGLTALLAYALSSVLGIGALGALGIGAMVAVWVASLIEAIASGIQAGDWSKLAMPLLGGLGAALGFCLGGLPGAAIGLALGELAGALFTGLYDHIKEAFGLPESTSIADVIGACISAALSALAGAFWRTVTIPIGTAIGSAVTGSVENAAGGMVLNGVSGSLAGALKGGIVGAIAGLAGGLFSNLLNGWLAKELGKSEQDLDNGAVGQSIGGLIGGIAGLILSGGNPIGAAIGTIAGQLIGGLAGLFTNDILDAVAGWWNDLCNIVSTAIDNFDDALANFCKNVDLVQIGLDIILGLMSGMDLGLGLLLAMVNGLFEDLINFVKDLLGIHSPSTVFEDIGRNIIQGLLNGIQEIWNSFIDFISTGLQKIVELFTNCASGLSNWATNTWNIISTWALNTSTEISNWVTNTVTSITEWITSTATGIADWVNTVGTNITEWANNVTTAITDWITNTGNGIKEWATTKASDIREWATNSVSNITNFVNSSISNFVSFTSTTGAKIQNWAATTSNNISNMVNNCLNRINQFVTNALSRVNTFTSNAISRISSFASNFTSRVSSAMSTASSRISSFCSDTLSKLSSWASNVADKISSALSRAASAVSSAVSSASSAASSIASHITGHATGGIFTREHLAMVSEGNKAEAIIPLQDQSAMQPFVDAVSRGLTETLAPIMANMNNSNSGDANMQPLYVGTLIADERGLKELERKMRIIQVKEDRRRS